MQLIMSSLLPYQFEPENADDQADRSEPTLQARIEKNVSQWGWNK